EHGPVVAVTAGDHRGDRATVAVHGGVDLRRQPPTGTPDAVPWWFTFLERASSVIRRRPLCPGRGAWCSPCAVGTWRSWRPPTPFSRSGPRRRPRSAAEPGTGARCRLLDNGGGASTPSATARTARAAVRGKESRSVNGTRSRRPPAG